MKIFLNHLCNAKNSDFMCRNSDFMCVFLMLHVVDLPEIKGNHRKFRTLVTSYIGKSTTQYLIISFNFPFSN